MKNKVIILIIFIVIVMTISAIFIVKDKESNEESYKSNIKQSTMYSGKIQDSNYSIEIKNLNTIVYDTKIDFEAVINNGKINGSKIKIYINDNYIDEFNIFENNNKISFQSKEIKEGINNIHIEYTVDDNIIGSLEKDIFYIKKYQNQFLDKFSNVGFSSHFGYMYSRDNDADLELIKNLGCSNLRDDIRLNLMDQNYSFEWIEKLAQNDINLYAIILPPSENGMGTDGIINNIDELNNYSYYANIIKNKYDKNIYKYEIMNEPNFKIYTPDNIYWYSEMTKKSKKILQRDAKDIVVGATCASGVADNKISSFDFFGSLNQNKLFRDDYSISFHSYDLKHTYENMHNKLILNHQNMINEMGGFTELIISEYGVDTSKNANGLSEDQQSDLLVIESIINLSENIKNSYIYSFRDLGFDEENAEHHYGIITHDYKLKKSYYAMKNFFTNINGSEYIGKINLNNNLEGYLFDKDGKAKIVTWVKEGNDSTSIDINQFEAMNIYGNGITPQDGKIAVTTSPVYLDNVSDSYFYQAISNNLTMGYSEFNTKYADNISKVTGLSDKIDKLSTYATNLKNVSIIDENTANNLMKNHFELGNLIIEAYKSGKLNVEYVKLSSMLDYLNTIGNSYEDLVTVSAKTRLTDLTDITNEVNKAKSLVENNDKFDIIYPNKIYKFSQDFLDESNYILGLKEENDIKTGLINSKALHALYLAQWSQEFSEIYIRDSYKDSVNNIINTNLSLKNKYSSIYSNQEIANRYNDLINSLNDIIENSVNNNYDIINDVFSKQFELNKIIIKKYNSKDISIDDRSYKDLIQNLIDLSDKYKTLFNIYVKNYSVEDNEVEDTLNNVINRYNANTDIDLTQSTDLINQAINIYDNSITTESISDNELNKQRIIKTCEMISSILENDIKKRADEESKFIKITYSEDINNFTNKDIVATINLPNDKDKVTNNNGQKCYTFTKNGNITYNVNIRGYDYTYNISINNIDKKTPNLIGLENSKLFSNIVTPKVIEENLSQVKLQYEGKTDIKYNLGDSISEPGIYTLTVTDKAGNTSSNNFIVSGTYNKSIDYIPVYNDNTKVNELTQNTNYKIIRNGQELSSDSLVATGDRFESGNKEFTLILRGDIDGDGTASIKDLLKIRKKIIDLVGFNKLQEMSADINHDGNVDIRDLVRMRKMIIQLE